MTTREQIAQQVRALLKNHELKVVLEAPSRDYRFEYYTIATKDAVTDQYRYARTYRLIDLNRGGITQEPWDTYDVNKQIDLVTNLLDLCRYKISKVVAGWRIKCPSCGHVTEGKIWQAVPRACPGRGSSKCQQKVLDDSLVEEIVLDTET